MGQERFPARDRLMAVAFMAVVAATLASCSNEPTAPHDGQPSAAELARAVTGDAAAKLSADGRFQLPSVVPNGPYPEITVAQANALAIAWAREFGPLFMELLEKEHGGPINFAKLQTCGRTLYAETPYEPPPEFFHVSARRVLGSQWLVTLCDRGVPSVSLSVAARSTDLTIVNGKVEFPFSHGDEFFPMGIPLGHTGDYPMSPERAAVRIFELTGRRVTTVPTLILPGRPFVAQLSRWGARLEGAATLRSRAGLVERSEAYTGISWEAGKHTVFDYVTALEQPTALEFLFIPPGVPGETIEQYLARVDAEKRMVPVNRKPLIPVVFHIVDGRTP